MPRGCRLLPQRASIISGVLHPLAGQKNKGGACGSLGGPDRYQRPRWASVLLAKVLSFEGLEESSANRAGEAAAMFMAQTVSAAACPRACNLPLPVPPLAKLGIRVMSEQDVRRCLRVKLGGFAAVWFACIMGLHGFDT